MQRSLKLVAASVALCMSACVSPSTERPDIGEGAAKSEEQEQADYALRSRVDDQKRLLTVVERLYAANLDLCPDKKPWLGVNYTTVYAYSAQMRGAAKRVLNAGSAPTILRTGVGGPAEKAGLKASDTITAVNDITIASAPGSMKALEAAIDQALAKNPMRPIRLTVTRNEESMSFNVTPEMSCAYTVGIVDSSDLNAMADGSSIVVTRAMMRFAQSDNELALIVSHELAHNTERHLQSKRNNQLKGALGGILLDVAAAAAGVDTQGGFSKAAGEAGAEFASPEFEAEADYVGMYFMARAGYDTTDVATFWRRMAAEAPRSIFTKSSHPSSPQRYLAISAADKEIRTKREGQQVLLPNRQAKSAGK